jgi:hypothetical protein
MAFLLSFVLSAAADAHQHHGGDGGTIERLGAVHMPIACAAAVQAPFERGVALLHSFWYEEAAKQFQAVADADPHCAMAYWGLAMTQWRPFWDGIDDARRKAGVAQIDQAAAIHPASDREARYVAALGDYLHAPADQSGPALAAYNGAMGKLAKAYPDDVEARAFYGLGLAAVTITADDPVPPGRKALAVLLPGFEAHPDHPGFAHYIIHTCDNPALAREALPAALHYAAIAPSSAHALHMPGHIFARLGMWHEDIVSNAASVKASEDAEAQGLDGAGHQLHADEFLLYADLQIADDAAARRTLDLMEPLVAHLKTVPNIDADGMMPFASYFQVELPAIYGLETGDWKAVLAIPEPPQPMASTKYYRAWAQAIAAGHLRDAAAADAATAGAKAIYDAAAAEGSPISLEIKAAQRTIDAWVSFAYHDDAHALQQIAEAADLQDRAGQAEVDIPAREMYADMLLIDDRPAEALAQYRIALKLSPNRFNGLYHAGRAAEAVGKPADARTFYRQLLSVTAGDAQSKRAELTHARDFIEKAKAKGEPAGIPARS